VREKTLTPPLPLPYRGGEQTTNVIKYQNKSHATIPLQVQGIIRKDSKLKHI
jgi:hypothetical protein